MRTFIVTLKNDDERRKPLLRALDAQRIAYELTFGVDGRRGLPSEFESQIDRSARARNGAPLTDGEFACALSHRSIYQRMVEERIPAALILEDDAIIHPRLSQFLSAWDLGVCDILLLDHSQAWGRKAPSFQFDRFSVHRLKLAEYNPSFNTGYLLTNRGAEALYAASCPVRSVADWPLSLCNFGAMAVTPRLVDHLPPETAPSHLRELRHTTRQAYGKKRSDSAFTKLKLSVLKRFGSKRLSVTDPQASILVGRAEHNRDH